MDAASFQFLLFGLTTAAISNLGSSRIWRSVILLLASVVFLGSLAPNLTSLLPLTGFLLLGYVCLITLDRGLSRYAAWSVIAVISAYVWLKEYTFLPQGSFLRIPYLTLGLSYIFFRVLHLLIEAADEKEKRHIGLGAYLLYTLNFTTFVSGPIQRYETFARDQFAVRPIALGPRVVGLQLERIIRGFFKVNVLAMLLHTVHKDALVQMSQPVPPSLKLFAAFQLALVYPIFLYANFSGYIDIVIAMARLMRVRLPENFDRPFSSSSFLEFWSRWHITLSMWLKTYVYNPLMLYLMRRISSSALEPFLGVFCFFVTFFLVGLWHGRTSEFVVFGLFQGCGVAINKLWQLSLVRAIGRTGYRTLATNSFYIAFGRGLTFTWFAFTLVWFWAGWAQIDRIFDSIGGIRWVGVWLTLWICATCALALWEVMRRVLLSFRTTEGPVFTSRYARVIYASALGLCSIVIMVLRNQPAPGIVYKAF